MNLTLLQNIGLKPYQQVDDIVGDLKFPIFNLFYPISGKGWIPFLT